MNFWDSSAVVEAYDTSSGMQARFASLLLQKTVHAASRLILPEVYSALARRARGNSARANVLNDSASETFARFSLYTVSDELIDAAVELVRKEHLRGADAIHLATAMSVSREAGRKRFVFISLDQQQAAAARNRGLRVIGA